MNKILQIIILLILIFSCCFLVFLLGYNNIFICYKWRLYFFR